MTAVTYQLHGEFHFSDMKISDKHVNIYLYLTDIYVFVCTGQHCIFKHNATTNNGETYQVCSKKVQSFSHTTQCRNCLMIYHSKCVNVNKTKVLRELWYCRYCAQAIFPYNHFDDDDDFYSAVIEGILDYTSFFRLHEINSESSSHLKSMTVLTPPLLIQILTISITQIFITVTIISSINFVVSDIKYKNGNYLYFILI